MVLKYLAFAVFRKIAQEANAVHDDLSGAGGLTQPNEKIFFFLFPKRTELSKSDQKERSKIFSLLAL